MFNELLAGGEIWSAKELFEIALDRYFYLGNFNYNDLIDRLCKDEKLEDVASLLHAMKNKEYGFDPASFLSVTDGLGKRGNKQEADELSEIMMEMETKGRVADKVYRIERDDGSGIALKTLKQVQKGWGRESLLCSAMVF
ncbi:hypothetical protein C1H46_000552 [Malus baccata]|uniref:Pentacotripeptide-repeat region of PRORP domain-containing protein n=1 Tax=Malus baccata TaxID=106549 RepID=A0A540NSB4_MALBA|nr:hypothetical protein C1H46_000552 [Malus baccata]